MANVIAEDGVERRHRRRLGELLDATKGTIRIASAYVTDCGLLSGLNGRRAQLLTALSPIDIASGATSLESLGSMSEAGVEVKVLPERPRLHAKVYIFGRTAAVVTSANLTLNALDSNLEVGVEVAGLDVAALLAWYRRLWRIANVLTTGELIRLKRLAEPLRRHYAELKQHANARLQIVNAAEPNRELIDHPIQAIEVAERYFLCNTDRKQGRRTTTNGYLLEQAMYASSYAAVWEDFRYPTHMDRVQPGDIIFMFARGVGIIGVGRALAIREILDAEDPHRIRIDDYMEPEWRIPVQWLAWWDDPDAIPHRATNNSFLDISGEEYESLRRDVLDRLRNE